MIRDNEQNPIINQNINILYNNFNNYPLNNRNSNNNQNNNLNPNIKFEINSNEDDKNNNYNSNDNPKISNEKNVKLSPSQYIFEKFGKRGWQCENCNNFNFESRIKCNRCGVKMKPKIIKKQKKEPVKKEKTTKKGFVEKTGDWICPNCTNINFAFRNSCNRCQLSKQKAFLIFQKMQLLNNSKVDQLNKMFNMNNTQNIINHFQNMKNINNNIQNMNNIPNNFQNISNLGDGLSNLNNSNNIN
jgi:hypothetical protein